MLSYVSEMWTLALQGSTQGVHFWAGIYVLLVCSYSLVFQRRVAAWPSTVGELSRRGLRKFGATERVQSEQQYVADALYSYQVEGQEYSGKRVSTWAMVTNHNAAFLLRYQLSQMQQPSENQVMVHYSPQAPHKSYLVKPGKLSQAFTAAISVFPLAAYIFMYEIG